MLAAFYGDGADELHLAFNFVLALSQLDVERLKAVVRETEAPPARGRLPLLDWPPTTTSSRFPTRWADGDGNGRGPSLVMLLTLRGTPVLYYGDEIGMQQRRCLRVAAARRTPFAARRSAHPDAMAARRGLRDDRRRALATARRPGPRQRRRAA